MNKSKKMKILKVIILILVIAMITISIVYLLPILKNLNTQEGQLEFKEKVNESKFIGMLMLFGLQVAQIFIAILPGEPIEVLAGICFGTIWGTVFLMFSIFITTVALYYFVKKYGRKFICEFISEDKLNKIENSKLFKDEKKIELVMILIFLIPGTPKDLFVYIGGILPIKSSRFIAIATLLRFPSVISSTIAGDNLLSGKWEISILAYVITFVITILVVLIINKHDKTSSTGDILRSIKNKEI